MFWSKKKTGGMSESAIQTAVHAMELGEWAKYIRVGLFALTTALLIVWYVAVQFRGFEIPEAMDQAQLGRNLACGEGFTTQFIRPISAWRFVQQTKDSQLKGRHPDMFNAPLFPCVLATAFKAGTPSFEVKAPPPNSPYTKYPPEILIVVVCEVFFLLSAGALYVLARQLFDKRIAFIALSLFVLSDVVHRYSISGLPTTMLMFLFLCIQLCLVNAHLLLEQAEKRLWVWVLCGLAGLLCGLAVLTRYSAAWLILPALGYIGFAFGKQRWICLGLAAALCVVVLVPWMVRNNQVIGKSFGLAGYSILEESPKYPTDQLARSFKNLDEKTTKQVARKFVNGVRNFAGEAWEKNGAGFAAMFFVAGLLFRFKKPEVLFLRRVVLWSVLLACMAFAFGGEVSLSRGTAMDPSNLIVVMCPGIILFGVAFFFLLFDRVKLNLPLLRHAGVALFVLLCALPLVFSQLSARGRPSFRYPSPPYYEPSIAWAARWYQRQEVMVSDMPWAVAWYGDRKCLWLPNTLEEFYQINDFHERVPGMYITPISLDRKYMSEIRGPELGQWSPIFLFGQVPKGFPLLAATAVPGQVGGQFLYADRKRWSEEITP